MKSLPREFYDRDTLEVAKDLLGCLLVREYEGERLVGRITETEAYIGRCDKACHAYGYKRTGRTETLFARPGTAYLYLIYGMYTCLNFVTEREGEPAAVLIRAIEAVAGEETMARLRFGAVPEKWSSYQRKNFLNGPGKVCKALSLDKRQNGHDLLTPPLYVLPRDRAVGNLHCGPRIGIDYAQDGSRSMWTGTGISWEHANRSLCWILHGSMRQCQGPCFSIRLLSETMTDRKMSSERHAHSRKSM